MPYDDTKDPYRLTTLNYGTRARVITPHDTSDLDVALGGYPLAIEVVAAGNLKVLPLKAEGDAEAVTITAVTPGYRPGFRVRRVFLTGTTCTVVGIERP